MITVSEGSPYLPNLKQIEWLVFKSNGNPFYLYNSSQALRTGLIEAGARVVDSWENSEEPLTIIVEHPSSPSEVLNYFQFEDLADAKPTIILMIVEPTCESFNGYLPLFPVGENYAGLLIFPFY